MKNEVLHRVCAFLRHHLTAWNSTGEGIHSPYLFRLVRFVLRDENSYYCFADIERRRAQLLSCEDVLDVVDYGSAGSPQGTHVPRRVCDIARYHLENARIGQLLFRIVCFLHEQEQRPLEIVELGTSLGITTAYLAAADSRNRVQTFEGSGEVLKVAQGVWRTLRLENISWQEGNIDDTLYIRAREHIDLAYVDANHTYDATMRYVDCLLPRMTEKGIIVLDDIHHSDQMERAWEKWKADKRVTSTMDLYHVGLLFVDTHYWKRNYRIRV
jgi:predicted O-methyltransferase YrrM